MYPPPQMTFGNRWRRCNALQQALQQHNMNMQLGAIPNINHLGLPGAPPSLYPGQVPGGQVSYACFFLRICMYPPPHMHELLPWTRAGSGLICMFPPPHMHVSSSSYAGRPPVKFSGADCGAGGRGAVSGPETSLRSGGGSAGSSSSSDHQHGHAQGH